MISFLTINCKLNWNFWSKVYINIRTCPKKVSTVNALLEQQNFYSEQDNDNNNILSIIFSHVFYQYCFYIIIVERFYSRFFTSPVLFFLKIHRMEKIFFPWLQKLLLYNCYRIEHKNISLIKSFKILAQTQRNWPICYFKYFLNFTNNKVTEDSHLFWMNLFTILNNLKFRTLSFC